MCTLGRFCSLDEFNPPDVATDEIKNPRTRHYDEIKCRCQNLRLFKCTDLFSTYQLEIKKKNEYVKTIVNMVNDQ